ncbi:Uncharacterized protein APZ42_004907 [Daphnia magna]|uniref:Uncharacterized protein n=1 Tax=Daphnia magna TaxID=35525 RepID=A0A164GRY2_9CRUS|nr:Uncharacterized protein APZ42_004907 [Daphnia magna]
MFYCPTCMGRNAYKMCYRPYILYNKKICNYCGLAKVIGKLSKKPLCSIRAMLCSTHLETNFVMTNTTINKSS